jgi:adenylate cyclase class 2
MHELEVKVLGVDIEDVKNKIKMLVGKLVKKEQQENYIYALPPHMKDERGYIRIRRVHDLINDSVKNIMCIKTIVSQEKYRTTEEHEFEVLDFKESTNFLKGMRLEFAGQHDKYRESYNLKDTLIEIDIWDRETFPEPYLEIEATDEKNIFEVLDLLEIPHEKATSKTLEEIKEEMGIK